MDALARGSHGRQRLAALAIALAATLPFLHKAYHIDDVLYLRVADQILHTPLDPYSGLALWDAPDGQPASLFKTDFNPPLWKYLLAGVLYVFGREEWKLHLLESGFIWLAALGLLELARRFTRHPLWCVAMVLWSPFFLPGQNIMLEGPLLCFSVWSVEWQWRAWESGRRSSSLLAGCLLALGVLTKYPAGLLLVLFGAAELLRRGPRSFWWAAPPTIALAGWFAHNYWMYGQSHLTGHGVVYDQAAWMERALTLLRCVGAVALFGPLLASALVRKGGWGWCGLTLGVAFGLAGGWFDLHGATMHHIGVYQGVAPWPQLAHLFFFTVHGGLVLSWLAWLVVSLRWGSDRAVRGFDERMFLALWASLFLVFNVSSVPFQAVRHLLLALVPMTLLVARIAEDSQASWRGVTLAVSTVLGFGLAAADYQQAGYYRDLAQTAMRKESAAGKQVWFTGTWGFAYYAVQKDVGALPVLDHPKRFGLPGYKAGDVVFNPKLLSWKEFPPKWFPKVRAVEHLQPAAINPLRTIAPNVNFYSVLAYSLPWEILIQAPSPDEPTAYFELPPLDDVIVFELLGP